MVAYNFQSAFVGQVHSGAKCQTIRRHRRPPGRHARPGEPVQLYRGMRTKRCLKLRDPDPLCLSVINIWIDVRTDNAQIAESISDAPEGWRPLTDEFAWADGFLNAKHMTRWWVMTHGRILFDGVLIKWEGLADDRLLQRERPFRGRVAAEPDPGGLGGARGGR